MSLVAADDMNKLKELSARQYHAQAQFFLTAFWDTYGEAEAENVWTLCQNMIEIDEKNGKEGNELDELTSHRFLEQNEQTLTVRELRDALREIDIDTNKMMSLSEYLIYRFKSNWYALVNSIQGDKETINKAEKLLGDAQTALDEASTKESEARASEATARSSEQTARNAEAAALEAAQEAANAEAAARAAQKQAEDAEATARREEAEAKAAADASDAAAAAAKSAEDEAQAAEDAVRAAEAEVQAGVDSIAAQQQAYDDRLADLEAKSKSGGMVSRGKAAHELAQAKQEDPLPLRRAKITQEVVLKKAAKASAEAAALTAIAAQKTEAAREAAAHAAKEADEAQQAANHATSLREAATAAADNATAQRQAADDAAQRAADQRAVAEAATAAAVLAREASEAATQAANDKLKEAEDFLEEAKNTMPNGTIWWLERELEEKKKYLPQSKGGYSAKN